jgi:hypothetical protein
MKKRNKAKAIRDHCLDCCGGTTKEVTLCTAVDCPLWEYRTGSHVSSQVYRGRMETALRNYAADITDICKDPDLAPFFQVSSSKTSHGRSKREQK